jgi:ADP-ribose pyrophosphatase
MNGEDPAPLRPLSPIASRTLHDGRIVHLSLDSVRLPDGSVGELEMIRHSGAAAILPLLDPLADPDPRVVLVSQFRYAAGGHIYEVPAGRPDRPGEPWEECARRELEEEIGLVPGALLPLTTILTTPGFTDERIHLFLATDLRAGTTARDTDEFMEPITLRMSAALDMVRDGTIVDAKTICTLLYAAMYLRQPPAVSGNVTQEV